MFVLLVLASLALTLPLWLFWQRDSKRQRVARALQRLPGPISLPLIGNMYKAFNVPRNELFKMFDTESRRYWPLFRSWNGPQGEAHLCDADHIEAILRSSTNIDKGYVYTFLGPWLGTGLLTGTGRKWHSHRKLITPTFHFRILDSFLEVFVEKTKILLDKLETEVGNHKGFDVYPYITLCALDIICETAMGTEINAQINSKSPYVMAIYGISELTLQRFLKPWLYNDFIYYLTEDGTRFQKNIDLVHGFTNKVIRERKGALKNCIDVTVECDDDVIGQKKRKVFLDLLLEASENGKLLSDEEIREEVDTFMFEGHDTTSASLCWTLFLLGTYPKVQERVFEELAEIFHGSNREPTMSDLAKMKYLEQVIKESLRLFPSVPFITRSLTQDVQIDDHLLPAGSQVMVHIYHVHRNPKYYPNPDTFDPDNFLPERVQGRHPYAYVPFSAGPRNCIGQKFALLEEKTVLSSIIRKFKVRATEKLEDINLMLELILRPDNGINICLELR